MKTFLAVFLAIIAAAGLIFGAWRIYLPVAQFEDAKQGYLLTRAEALDRAKYISGSDESRLAQLTTSMTEARRIENALANVLAHKPYGLSLTHDESSVLTGIKTSQRRHAIERIEAAFRVYAIDHNEKPSGTAAEIVKILESDLDAKQCLDEANAKKNSKGELVDPFGNPFPMTAPES